MKKTFRPMVIIGAGIAIFFIFVVIFGRFFMPNDPLHTNMLYVLQPPSSQFPLGTDNLGRCVLSRLISGCGRTLGAAILIEIVLTFIGFLVGVIAGYFGGVFDTIAIAIIDVLLAFPSLILALVIAGLLGAGLNNLIIAMISVYWVNHARITRNLVRSIKDKEYIISAKALGGKPWSIIWQHVIPNSFPTIFIYSTLDISSIILGLASMSFIGLGVQPPYAEWGAIMNEARSYMRTNPQMLIFTTICIVLSVACFQMLGEALKDQMNPRKVQIGLSRKERRKRHVTSKEPRKDIC